MTGLGFHGGEDFKVSGFDVRDALVGQSVAYEFDIEVDEKVVPFKLLEDVSRWDFVDLPIFRPPPADSGDEEKALAERKRTEEEVVSPVLPPFQIAGPMELWIQDADDLRLALPVRISSCKLFWDFKKTEFCLHRCSMMWMPEP